jgi:DnaK suppressor protein
MSGTPGDAPGRDHRTPEDALEHDRAETSARIEALERDLAHVVAASELVPHDDEHDPEGATIAYDRAQLGAVLEQARQHLRAVDAALARVVAGTYGNCAACGQPIALERLAVRPATETCIRCAALVRRRA